MKILFFIDSLKAGGKERQLVELIKSLNLYTEYEFILILMSYDIFYKEIKNYNIEIKYLIRKNKNDIKVFFKLYRICKTYAPDIIHTWDLMTSFYVLPISRLLGIKMINGSIRHGIRLYKLSHLFRSFLAKISPYVLANSEAGLKANGLKENERNFILYNGINKKFKKQKNIRDNLIIDIEEIQKGKKIILISISRLSHYKDYFTVIKALARMRKSGYDFLYLIIGNGPMKNDIQSEIEKFGLINTIKLLGIKEDVEKYFFISDIFIHSSKGEGCSNVILEAMYSGLPIVATDTGGTREIVTSENGLLFEYKNINDLYNKLKYLIDNPEVRSKFSKNSIKIVEKKFTSKIMVKNYIKILNKILNRNN